jgi:hypothetical protein
MTRRLRKTPRTTAANPRLTKVEDDRGDDVTGSKQNSAENTEMRGEHTEKESPEWRSG